MDVRSAAKRRAPHRSESEPAKRSNARLHGRNSTWHEGSGELVDAKETRLGAERSFERVAGMVAAAAARTDNGSALDWEYRLAVQRRRSQRLQGRLHRGALSGRDGTGRLRGRTRCILIRGLCCWLARGLPRWFQQWYGIVWLERWAPEGAHGRFRATGWMLGWLSGRAVRGPSVGLESMSRLVRGRRGRMRRITRFGCRNSGRLCRRYRARLMCWVCERWDRRMARWHSKRLCGRRSIRLLVRPGEVRWDGTAPGLRVRRWGWL